MYSREQVEPLFDLIEVMKSSKDGLNAEAFARLCSGVELLKAREQVLVIGTHEHKFGESHYLFLVPKGQSFGIDELVPHLEEEFEPENDESLSTDRMSAPVVIG